MSSEYEVVYEINKTPSEVAEDVVANIERSHRKLLEEQDARLARKSLRRARKTNIRLLSALNTEYGLGKEEIKEYVGRDVNKINDELANLSTKMNIAYHEQRGRGDADIERSTLSDMMDVQDKMENFRDLLKGIDEGQARIQQNE